MPRYAMHLEFDGTAFRGTAPQPGQRTLHGLLRSTLAQLDGGGPVLSRSSGRLDTGVSALGLVVHCDLHRVWEPAALGRALNGHLDHDVAVLRAARVSDDWDALLEPSVKSYCYRVLERGAGPVLDRRVYCRRKIARPELLGDLARLCNGERDLSAFACLRGDDSDAADPWRSYRGARWEVEPVPGGALHCFRISGNGFLYKQVRGLVGAMLGVAQGLATSDEFRAAIDAGRSAKRVGEVAPARGLLLEAVRYRAEPAWQLV